MIRYLAAAITAALLAAACDSRTPTAPSVNPQPSAVPPAQPGSGPAPVSGSRIVAGSPVRGIVESGDPICFPTWDSSGHCRQFDLTATSDVILRATLKWEGPSRGVYDPELFLILPDGTWVYSDTPGPERHLTFHGSTGQSYHIVVIGYQPPQEFEVLVELQ